MESIFRPHDSRQSRMYLLNSKPCISVAERAGTCVLKSSLFVVPSATRLPSKSCLGIVCPYQSVESVHVVPFLALAPAKWCFDLAVPPVSSAIKRKQRLNLQREQDPLKVHPLHSPGSRYYVRNVSHQVRRINCSPSCDLRLGPQHPPHQWW